MKKNQDKINTSKFPFPVSMTPGGGWYTGILPEGCRLCMLGLKVVYFMGSDCIRPAHCRWYCPLSSERKKSRNHYINEIPVKEPNNVKEIIKVLIEEVRTIGAQGMSITGGEPLRTPRKIEQIFFIIQAMKAEFGDSFHVHLYTSGVTFDLHAAKTLEMAGLDELRFHPSPNDFHKMEYATGRSYVFGAEVPVIPTQENHKYLLSLADYLENIGGDFINLNEFEICETNRDELLKRGFSLKQDTIAAVEGSEKYALKFLEEFAPQRLNIHYCPVAVKDAVQIRERYKRRAEHIKRDLEEITEDGTLLFLRLEGGIKTLEELYKFFVEDAGIPSHLIDFIQEKGVLDLPPFLSEEKDFIELIKGYRIKAGIYEILPFRQAELYRVVEYTPIINNLRF